MATISLGGVVWAVAGIAVASSRAVATFLNIYSTFSSLDGERHPT
jgi:hypothetical protein